MPKHFTTDEKIHLCDMLNPDHYLPIERNLAKYLLVLADDEPALVDLARYVIDFPQGEDNA